MNQSILHRIYVPILLCLAALLAACSTTPSAQPTVAAAPTASTQPTVPPEPTAPTQPTALVESTATTAAPAEPTVPAESTVVPAEGTGSTTPTATQWYPRLTTLPAGRVVNRASSMADETGFTLVLDNPADPQDSVMIRGGAVNPPPTFNGDPVTIRGLTANTFSTGGGLNIFYEEAGIPYSITAGLGGAAEADAIAVTFEFVDLAAWQTWLAATE